MKTSLALDLNNEFNPNKISKPKKAESGFKNGLEIPDAVIREGKEAHPALKRNLELNNVEALRAYNANYKRMVGTILSMHNNLAKADKIDSFHSHVIKYIDNLFEISKKAVLDEIEIIKSTDALDLSDIEYMDFPKKEVINGIPVHNPSLGRFLNIIKEVDHLLTIYAYLYASGQIDVKEKQEIFYKWPFFVKRTTSRVQKCAAMIRDLVDAETTELETKMNDLRSGLLKYQANIAELPKK